MSSSDTATSVNTEAIQQAIKRGIVDRIWAKDSSLWKSDGAVRKTIDNRLGWLTAPEHFAAHTRAITQFAVEAIADGITSVVLLGMGGSSLCVEVLRETFRSAEGWPQMQVLDSTHPDQLLRVERAIDLDHTLFIVASKSGTTLESDSFFQYFWSRLESAGNERGKQFCAITDPGTVLEELGRTAGFRHVFVNPPDIGGRFSALSYFGLVPAALMGVNIDELLERAIEESERCRRNDEENPGLALGVLLSESLNANKDKMTLITSGAFSSFGYWAEQLIAESTGKEGKGILPIEGESNPAALKGDDRFYVEISTTKKPTRDDAELLLAQDAYSLGAQFFRCEFATAVVGALMGINPFDEPNVAESKAQTNKVLSQYEGRLALTFPDIKCTGDGMTVAGPTFAEEPPTQALKHFLESAVKPHGYIAVMAYLDRNPEMLSALNIFRDKLEAAYHVPVTIGFGPRFLHSTGQLHKGGPNTGVFVQFIDTPKEDAVVPTKSYTFGTLVLGQAIGDYEALKLKGKSVINLNLGSDPIKSLSLL